MSYRFEDVNGNPLSYRDEVRAYIIESRHPWISPANVALMDTLRGTQR